MAYQVISVTEYKDTQHKILAIEKYAVLKKGERVYLQLYLKNATTEYTITKFTLSYTDNGEEKTYSSEKLLANPNESFFAKTLIPVDSENIDNIAVKEVKGKKVTVETFEQEVERVEKTEQPTEEVKEVTEVEAIEEVVEKKVEEPKEFDVDFDFEETESTGNQTGGGNTFNSKVLLNRLLIFIPTILIGLFLLFYSSNLNIGCSSKNDFDPNHNEKESGYSITTYTDIEI